jgi:alkanesulfonate monooxygenase SsuD/methylene tetrahydromethanopterin reductase-like flavin-dependent oxidoreductase (luciferase family)
MKVDVFCSWGDGPDVGINIERSEQEVAGWKDPHLHCYLDFTAAEARAFAAKMIAYADEADWFQSGYEAYYLEFSKENT